MQLWKKIAMHQCMEAFGMQQWIMIVKEATRIIMHRGCDWATEMWVENENRGSNKVGKFCNSNINVAIVLN